MNWGDIEGKTLFLSKRTTLANTMKWLKKIAFQSSHHPQIIQIAERLSKQKDPVKAVFDYAYDNVLYQADPDNIQRLRYAHRTLSDKAGNCTDYSILISALLQAMNIPHKFRIAMFEPGIGFEHIYVITNDGKVLDPVIGQAQDGTDTWVNRPGKGSFDTELSSFKYRDYQMVQLQALGGTRRHKRLMTKVIGATGCNAFTSNCDCKKLCDNMFANFLGHKYHSDCRAFCDDHKAKKTGWDPRLSPTNIARVSELYAVDSGDVVGCTDPKAKNFMPEATVNVQPQSKEQHLRCVYPTKGCKDPIAVNYDGIADLHDKSLCRYFNPDDETFDNPDAPVVDDPFSNPTVTQAGLFGNIDKKTLMVGGGIALAGLAFYLLTDDDKNKN